MTRATPTPPTPNPNPRRLTPGLARPYPSSPPPLSPPHVLTFDPLQITHAQTHISGH